MKISIITPYNNTFKGKERIVSNSLKLGAAVSASALFAAAAKDVGDPSRIINEYYEEENKHLRDRFLILPRRFSSQERYEILQRADDIKLKRQVFSKIINTKNDDDSYRFSAEDSLMIFDEVGEKIQKYPEIFNTILKEKNKQGKERFNVEDCVALMHDADFINIKPNTFRAVLKLKNLKAAECKYLLINVADKTEEDIQIFEKALQNKNDSVKDIVASVQKFYTQKRKAILREEAERQARIEAEDKAKQEQEAQLLKEREEKKKIRKEEKAALRLEKHKMKLQERLLADKEAGFVTAEYLFNKVNDAVTKNIPLVLESGETISDEMRDKIAENITRIPKKAARVVELRYHNNRPIFSEKECCEIISELGEYLYIDISNVIKILDSDGQPFFNAEQCKELLQLKDSCREYKIRRILCNRRTFSAGEVVEIMKNNLAYNPKFAELANETQVDGEYKYTVAECIEKCRV